MIPETKALIEKADKATKREQTAGEIIGLRESINAVQTALRETEERQRKCEFCHKGLRVCKDNFCRHCGIAVKEEER